MEKSTGSGTIITLHIHVSGTTDLYRKKLYIDKIIILNHLLNEKYNQFDLTVKMKY